jgi:hydrogenase expression/formation protein HypE
MTEDGLPENLLSCPVPFTHDSHVTMGHGGGGRLTNNLIESVFRQAFDNDALNARHDGAVFNIPAGRMAMTTDSYVVHPLFFPGGNIGTLAINGTVNDLAMCGARPLYLSTGFVIEEGLPISELTQIVEAMAATASESAVQVVTGDTKVVDRGKGDGLFVNTAGVGVIEHENVIGPASIQPGDAVMLSGDVGRHGMAVMAVREGLEFESTIESDCAPVAAVVMALLQSEIDVHCLRDLTRGGLASALVEISETAGIHIAFDELAVPVIPEVAAACEILGLDPMYVANEGRFICFCPADVAESALSIMRRFPVSRDAVQIGRVTSESESFVTMKSRIGVSRIVDLLSGEQLPRIC